MNAHELHTAHVSHEISTTHATGTLVRVAHDTTGTHLDLVAAGPYGPQRVTVNIPAAEDWDVTVGALHHNAKAPAYVPPAQRAALDPNNRFD